VCLGAQLAAQHAGEADKTGAEYQPKSRFRGFKASISLFRHPIRQLLYLVAPEDDAAEEADLVGDDADIGAEGEGDLFGVAAADVEEVPVEGGLGLLDGGFDEVIPAGLAEFVEAAAADVVLVGHALFAPGVVAEFEAGAEVAVGEEGRAEAGAEGEDELDAVALDGAVAGDIGVVADADGLLPALFQLSLKLEAGPTGMEVEGSQGGSVLDDAGKTDRDAIEFGQQGAEAVEAAEDEFRGGNLRGDDALALADGLACRIKKHGLQARAADVDGHGDGAG